MQEELSLEEKATNDETWKHIHVIRRLISGAQLELSQRALEHDQSKLSAPEVDTFTEFTPKLKDSTYGSEEYQGFLKAMKPALDNHYAMNRHHPEFFENGINDMNLIDLLEMIIDWKAASMRHDNGDINRSIEINTERFNLSPQLVKILQNTVPELDKWLEQFTGTYRKNE